MQKQHGGAIDQSSIKNVFICSRKPLIQFQFDSAMPSHDRHESITSDGQNFLFYQWFACGSSRWKGARERPKGQTGSINWPAAILLSLGRDTVPAILLPTCTASLQLHILHRNSLDGDWRLTTGNTINLLFHPVVCAP